jgi:hypothetical protein
MPRTMPKLRTTSYPGRVRAAVPNLLFLWAPIVGIDLQEHCREELTCLGESPDGRLLEKPSHPQFDSSLTIKLRLKRPLFHVLRPVLPAWTLAESSPPFAPNMRVRPRLAEPVLTRMRESTLRTLSIVEASALEIVRELVTSERHLGPTKRETCGLAQVSQNCQKTKGNRWKMPSLGFLTFCANACNLLCFSWSCRYRAIRR